MKSNLSDDLKTEFLTPLSKKDKERILFEFNNTKTSYPSSSIIELFEEQVLSFPHFTAVSIEDKNITYLELNKQANSVARWLLQKEVKQDQYIGLYCQRGIDAIIGMIAILKVGCAYVPLDPNYPKERLEYITLNSGINYLLKGCPETKLSHVEEIYIEEAKHKYTESENLSIKVSQNEKAYLIYTSGSTGTPKGVEIIHKSVVRLVRNTNYINITNKDVLAHASSIAFDAATFEIWGALLNGAKVEIIENDVLLNPTKFHNLLIDEEISIIFLTTMLYHQLYLANPNIFNSLNVLLVGGDVLSKKIVMQNLNQKDKPQHLVHVYGPTENTTFSTYHEMLAVDKQYSSIPIGRPISNSECYVINEKEQLVPVGELGELCLGGDGLSTGYLNDDKLNKKKYFINPLDKNKKLYKTGDLVRWVSGGNLEFVGRVDNQIKIRGYRVELEEIEYTLKSLDNIEDAVVLYYKEIEREMIVAFIIAKSAKSFLMNDFYEQIKSVLPDYMVPSYIDLMDHFPLNFNLKVDKKILLDRFKSHYFKKVNEQIKGHYDDVRELILSIYRVIFQKDDISIADDFFVLGGDSLLAFQIVSKLAGYSIEINVSDIFYYHNLNKISDFILEKYKKSSYDLLSSDSSLANSSQLTPSQAGMLFHMMKSHQPIYTVQVYFSVQYKLDPLLVEDVWNTLVERHDMLRSTFSWDEETPERHVEQGFDFKFIQQMNLSENKRNDVLNNILQDYRRVGVGYQKESRLRVVLIQFDIDYFVIMFIHNHLILDAWSLGVLINEFIVLYQSRQHYKNSYLETPAQYGKFVSWLNKQCKDKAKEFWGNALQNFPGKNKFLILSKKKSINQYDFERYLHEFSHTKSEKIYNFIKNQRITLSALVQSAWLLVLQKFFCSDDITVGLVISLLPNEIENINSLVGPIINTVPFRYKIDDSKCIMDMIRLVQTLAHCCVENGYFPLNELKKIADIKPNEEIFDSLFTVESYSSYVKSDLNIGRINVYDVNHYPLSIQFFPDDVLGVEWVYNSHLFSESMIITMLDCLKNILSHIIENPEAKVKAIEILPNNINTYLSYGNELFSEWNKDFLSLPHQFENQVNLNGNKRALYCEEESLTYNELNKKSNQLAHYILGLGIKPGTLIGVFTERNIYSIICIIAILKSGCAYVPIDSKSPEERIIYILGDAGADYLFVRSENVKGDLLNFKKHIIVYDSIKTILNEQSVHNINIDINQKNLAYVIYTSGSTGTPKGVAIQHKNLVSLFLGLKKYYTFSNQDIWTLFHSFSFDISVWEMWGAFLSGSTLIIVTDRFLQSSHEFYEMVVQKEVTVLTQTPSIFNEFISIDKSFRKKLSLKWIVFVGEPFRFPDIKKWYESHDDTPLLVNMYGPTESTVYAGYKSINKELCLKSKAHCLIGFALPRVYFLVLDSQLRPVPTYCQGELFIGGDQLAQCYLNRAELTNERFIEHPYYGRLYKTGDLVQVLPERELDFIGRMDDQVKHLGYRIELGEIEVAISSVARVKSAAVVLKKQQNSSYLVAYFTVEEDKLTFDIDRMKNSLKEFLPTYMIPTLFVILDQLPKNTSGKIDKKSLVSSDIDFKEMFHDFIKPSSVEQGKMVKVFSDVLGVSEQEISMNANFFDFGGHSLTSIKLLNEVNKLFKSHLSINNVIENPTPELLLKEISKVESSSPEEIDSPIVCLRKGAQALEPLFLIHSVGGTVLHYVSLVNHLKTNRPIYGLQDPALMMHRKLFDTIEEMAKYYLAYILNIQEEGPYYLAGSSFGATVAFELAKQLKKAGKEVRFLGLIDGWAIYPEIIGEVDYVARYFEQYQKRLVRRVQDKNVKIPVPWIDLHVTRNKMLREYRYEKLDIKLVLFKAMQIFKELQAIDEENNHWSQFSTFPIDLHRVQGDHDSMLDKENVADLASNIDEYL